MRRPRANDNFLLMLARRSQIREQGREFCDINVG